MSRLRIVFGNSSLARYPQGGGHWIWRLHYLLGLRALGHEVFLLELLWSSGDPQQDRERIASFFERLRRYGLHEGCSLLLFQKDGQDFELSSAEVFGRSRAQTEESIESADLLWNDCSCVRRPLLDRFRHRVFIDLDPGHFQVSALTADVDYLYDHEAYLSVGKKLHDADCEVPTLGLQWHTFHPFVYLPLWEVAPDPGPQAPFSSITHWTWGELQLGERSLSTSKRDGYLGYIELPARTGRPFQLAANIIPEDEDRELLQRHGWGLVDPWQVAGSPDDYQRYIAGSRAEILCPKPIFRDLRTGWFSDRSACYLASGRPVLAEETGFSDSLPTGAGLLAYRDLSEAVAAVAEIDADYARHMKAARELAEEYLDSQRCLEAMLAASG